MKFMTKEEFIKMINSCTKENEISKETRLKAIKNIFQYKTIKLLIDKEHKVMVIDFIFSLAEHKKIVLRCDERDIFDYRIGLGIAIHRIGTYKSVYKHLFKNKNSYYLYLVGELLQNRLDEFDKLVKAEQEDYEDRAIKEQVRKFECELRGIPYKAKKVTHKFIELKGINGLR